MYQDLFGEVVDPGFALMTDDERNLNAIDLTDRFSDFGVIVELDEQNPVEWVAGNAKHLKEMLDANGMVIIRGLNAIDPNVFRECVKAYGIELKKDYGDLPMTPSGNGSEGVYNVTKYPSNKAILFHSEGSHTHAPPRYISFQCSVAAESDGESPLANTKQILNHLPTEIYQKLKEKGLQYRRNFIPNLDVPWQRFYQTESKADVERMCRENNIQYQWTEEGGLHTQINRPAIVEHPESGAEVYFNQILLHHPSCLDPDVKLGLQNLLEGRDFPRDVRFGDGEVISDEWVAEILRTHLKVAVCFQWQPGDIVIADNWAVTHARRHYTGQRKHHVVLGK